MANRHLGEGIGGRAIQSADRLSNWKTHLMMLLYKSSDLHLVLSVHLECKTKVYTW